MFTDSQVEVETQKSLVKMESEILEKKFSDMLGCTSFN